MTNGRVEVLTYKDGLLARAAHDLLLEVQDFKLSRSGEAVKFEFRPGSLRVVGARHGENVDTNELSADQKNEIQGNIQKEILHTDKYPVSTFTGQGTPANGGYRVNGELELVGKRVPVSFDLHMNGNVAKGQVDIQPTLWGIQPYKALLGAIKLQDKVTIRFEVAV